jgi:hypothetical protein
VIVTFAPTAAGCGEMPVISGVAVKLSPSLGALPTVTNTGPEVAAAGTVVLISVLVHEVTVAVVPLNLTVLLPWGVPKPVPVMVTKSPVLPEFGITAVTLNPEETVKLMPLLVAPPATTTTLPVVAPVGTGTTMLVSLQLEGVAAVLLNLTLLVPGVWPKAAPVMVIVAPIPPFTGEMLVMPGPGETENGVPTLGPFVVVTKMFPVVAPSGTVVEMLVVVALVNVATVPLNVTVLAEIDEPKLLPEMVSGRPAGPDVADRVAMVARDTTVNGDPLLGVSPGIVTTTFPVVAPAGTITSIWDGLQAEGVVGVPLNVTVLVPCVLPKLEPAIETGSPTEPVVLVKKLMLGGEITVKLSALLTAPLGPVTTTFPVEANAGTGTAILVGPQLVGVAATPLKVTVLPPWLVPKPDPPIVTEVLAGPVAGDRPVRTGLGLTVKVCGLLATPPTVTTTLPVVAPAGGNVTIWVGPHIVRVAGVPLKVTLLVS